MKQKADRKVGASWQSDRETRANACDLLLEYRLLYILYWVVVLFLYELAHAFLHPVMVCLQFHSSCH
jgi:hypothetical protein